MVLTIILLSISLLVTPAAAQLTGRLQVDNDFMVVGPRHDRDYTHGVDASLGLRRCDPEACSGWRLGLVHALFTPDLLVPRAPPQDRPFAGYVGVRGALERWARRGAWQVTLTAGLRGPAALGEPLQRVVHELLGFVPPPSWHGQLATAPWLATSASGTRWAVVGPVRLGVLGGAELGTMRSSIEGGVRAGLGLDGRWLAPRAAEGVAMGFGLEAGERWIAGDHTLAGIDAAAQRRWRGWIGMDGTLQWQRWAVTVSMQWLGKEFDGQGRAPVMGAVRFQWMPSD
jgi:lipid A 3-O-deacylase